MDYFLFQKIERSSTTLLDRWSISITKASEESPPSDQPENQGSCDNLDRRVISEKMPFDIINNYFSIGVVRIIFDLNT